MAQQRRSLLADLSARVTSEEDSERDRLNKTLAIFACGLMGFGAMLWLFIYKMMGIRFSATVPLLYLVVSAASLALYLWNRNFALFRNVQVSLFLFVPFIMQWTIGSYVSASGVMLWALLAPLGVLIFQGPRESLPWFFAYMVMTGISGFFDFNLMEGTEQGVSAQSIAVFFSLNFAAVSTIVFLLLSYFVHKRNELQERVDEQHRLLKIEQEKSERLLLNILPGPIAERLKESSSTIADGFADVTVMFADIIDFTRLSGELPPQSVVALLNDVFSHFDNLAGKHGLEKIKTIGDAYMVAGGLLDSQGAVAANGGHDYSAAICDLALDMREHVRILSQSMPFPLEIHIGIGSGPVVAGVIGIKKFIYDLWGDTVNIAARITEEAGASAILVDATTYRRLDHLFDFDGPMTLENVKGKGDMTVYLLLGRKAGTEG